MSELTKEFTDQLYANYEANVKYAALENAVTHNGIHASLETRKSAVENTPVFSLDLTKDKVTNQKASGRCWMFAALNTFRHKMISSFQLEDFELSQAVRWLFSYKLHNKMAVNGIWWYPSLRNTEWFQNQFIQNRFLQAIAGN